MVGLLFWRAIRWTDEKKPQTSNMNKCLMKFAKGKSCKPTSDTNIKYAHHMICPNENFASRQSSTGKQIKVGNKHGPN